MNAAAPNLTASGATAEALECVAFAGDVETHGVVSLVAGQYFQANQVHNGGTKQALALADQPTPPNILIVDISEAEDPLTDVLSLTSAFDETTRLIGIGSINDVNLYRDLIEGGLSDYLVKPVTEKALAMCFESLQRLEAVVADTGPDEFQRVVVIGARGGVGASSVSVTLAWQLAEEQHRRTTLVDLDLEFGTIALALDLEPTHGLREALENPSRLDSLFIASAIAKFTDRMSVLATEETVSGDVEFNSSAIEILFDTLARNNDCIVVDLPRSAIGFRHRVLAAATHVVLVTDLSLASLRDSIRILAMIAESAPDTPITVVANRSGRKEDAMPRGNFQKTLGHRIDFFVPEDRKALKQAADTGKPLPVAAKTSKTVLAVREIARTLAPPKVDANRSGAWRFWHKKKGEGPDGGRR